jgi:hypothetical protein
MILYIAFIQPASARTSMRQNRDDLPEAADPLSNGGSAPDSIPRKAMPTYQVPDVIEVALNELELPIEVPVDAHLNEKPLADCTKKEVQTAVQAFSGLLRQSQSELEASIRKHNEIRRRVAHLHAYHQNFEAIDWVRDSD